LSSPESLRIAIGIPLQIDSGAASTDPSHRQDLKPFALHFGQRPAQLGAVILGLTLLGAAGGLAATFLKNGKLIIGPHLFVGLAVAVLVIATASLGPSLQKGKDWARGLHVAINGGVLLLFGWQAVSGIAIVQKLLSSAASPALTSS
jgi:hypothetical protein